MKRIYFDDMTHGAWIWLSILSVVLVINGAFKFYILFNHTVHELLYVIGFLIPVLFFGKMYLHKNYVQWNKKGVLIRINSWIKGVSMKYIEIKEIKQSSGLIEIIKKDGTTIPLDVTNINDSDCKKLLEIIESNMTLTN